MEEALFQESLVLQLDCQCQSFEIFYYGQLHNNYSLNSYEMSQLSFLDQLVRDLIRSKPTNYSQDCIPYYLNQEEFIIEDLPKVYNNRQERLKCSLVKHRCRDKSKENDGQINRKCIVYLHGLGSSRLEALNIIQGLPRHFCFCMFDLSGSGKSQGDYITYGLKQQEDIAPLLHYLTRKKHIHEFILWGRSMGAVATLLYAIHNHQDTNTVFATHSLSNSKIMSKQNLSEPLVKAVVLDSPFHNFKDIARQIAIRKVGVPSFILDIALNYLDQSFSRLLSQSIGEQYNPFRINFDNEIKLNLPLLFLYSEKDQIISSHHCERIIQNITSQFEKVPINDCTHNQSRPLSVIQDIFRKIDKFQRQQIHQQKRLNQSFSRDLSICSSNDRKRGIFVYTPSKEKDRRNTIEADRASLKGLRDTIDVQMIRTQQLPRSPRSRTSLLRKNPISLKCSRRVQIEPERGEVDTGSILGNLNTIDMETHKLLSQKLSNIREPDKGISKMVRSKRITLDKRKQIKLTHSKYLE